MADSRIDRNGKWIRPAFKFREESGGYSDESIIAQMTESMRNVLEGIASSQMLQCDVRQDIRKMRIALEKLAKRRRRVNPKSKIQNRK